MLYAESQSRGPSRREGAPCRVGFDIQRQLARQFAAQIKVEIEKWGLSSAEAKDQPNMKCKATPAVANLQLFLLACTRSAPGARPVSLEASDRLRSYLD